MIVNIQIRDLHERARGDPSHLHLNQMTEPPTLEPLLEMVTYYLAFFSSVAGSLPEASLSLTLPAALQRGGSDPNFELRSLLWYH